MNVINRLLSKNVSGVQLAGFILSNFVGLAIVIAGVQFWEDIRSIWESEDSFIRKDYLVVNKKVTASSTLGTSSSDFTEEEIADLEKQPWVRKVGRFSTPGYRVGAYMSQGGKALSTEMFFESIPSEFIDLGDTDWKFRPESGEVPIIISKDYLTLYNFGFATSQGMPQVSEKMMSSVPLKIRMVSEDGTRMEMMDGRVVGFSNRLNTILVPMEFLEWSNARLAAEAAERPSRRLIVDVSSPGDVAITRYLEEHDLELAGDKSGSQASYMLNVVTGVMVGVGSVITVLSFFILLLSISLLMQKNREKLHALIMLGYDLRAVGAPFRRLIVMVGLVSWLLGVGAMLIFRQMYAGSLAGVSGAHLSSIWISVGLGLILALLSILFNVISVGRKVKAAF